ncbi:unnamed protein product [Rhizophagus irregularis]|uniref:HMG box domain-containing protein n=1 Tax=Rhizophagus irregularis TaxID=588596 RepID=A0A2N1NKI3_9GLOM|nr:hypothetical protein RhiirC2_708836 [Rhizophagus irregularis]CAB4397320.1 unnamed protein product [Rhizophagus irregularis]CAB5384507.1 unnamed protein product [Rhizophagus irregularis]
MVKQNSIHGPLRNNLSKKSHKPSNSYIIFLKFYKKILDEEYPKLSSREKAKYAGKIWGFLPNNLKNSFIAYANNERLLKYGPPRPNIVQHSVENSQPESGLRVIFDDHCHKDVLLNESSNEIPSDESDHYDKIFDQYINEDAYI